MERDRGDLLERYQGGLPVWSSGTVC